MDMDALKDSVDEVSTQVDQLEQRMHEIERFYSENGKKSMRNSKVSTLLKDKDKGRQVSIHKQQQDAADRAAAASMRMQDLLREMGTILHQITQHKWAWPFMDPVDVEGLGLHNYYEVIEKPMDLGTIKKQLEASDGYKHVREACADMRLVFKNALKYNAEKVDVHGMAKKLLAMFEEKWLQLLPKVIEEERRLEEEEAQAQLNMQLSLDAAYAKLKNANDEIHRMDSQLGELRDLVVKNCRKMSIDEKRQLGTALTRLSPEDLSKALEIVGQGNPSFQTTAEQVDLDINAQSEGILWRLKFYVKDTLHAQGDDDNENRNGKRKAETRGGRGAKKRSKKAALKNMLSEA